MASKAETKSSKAGFTLRVAGAALAAAAIGTAIDCGGDNDNSPASNTTINTPIHPEATEMPSATAMAAQTQETPKPTALPETATPKGPDYGVAPEFADLSNSVDAALSSLGSSPLPAVVGTLDFFNRNLGWCNENNTEGIAPQIYGQAIVGACTTIAQDLETMHQVNPTPEIISALKKLRSYTLGTGGKVDQLSGRGKLPISMTIDAYKELQDTNFFSLVSSN